MGLTSNANGIFQGFLSALHHVRHILTDNWKWYPIFYWRIFFTFVQMDNMIWSTPKSRHAKAAWSLKLVKADDFRVAHDSKLEWTYNSDRNGTSNAAYEQFYSWSNAWTYIYFAYFYHQFSLIIRTILITLLGTRHLWLNFWSSEFRIYEFRLINLVLKSFSQFLSFSSAETQVDDRNIYWRLG